MMKGYKETPDNLNDEQIKVAETLLTYPSLEKVFDVEQPQNFVDMKEKMLSNITELERTVRRGTKEEADKATKIIEAFRTTIDFLDELEVLRSIQSKN